jgi:ketosteroid isomerase-like protein
MIMRADGHTRQMSLSAAFLWIMGILSLFTLVCLAGLSYLYVGSKIELDTTAGNLAFEKRFNEIRDYKQDVEIAPEEAKKILELLEQSLTLADSTPEQDSLIGVTELDQDTLESDQSAEQDPEILAPQAPDILEMSPEEAQAAVWAAWHDKLSIPNQKPFIDIEEFKVSVDGDISFILKNNSQPGERIKGRAIVVCLVADKDGVLSLKAAPEIDLAKPQEGWEKGSRYNIIASKVVRGKISIPEGGKILNAEVLAWEEDTKELVFLKKIKIEERTQNS